MAIVVPNGSGWLDVLAAAREGLVAPFRYGAGAFRTGWPFLLAMLSAHAVHAWVPLGMRPPDMAAVVNVCAYPAMLACAWGAFVRARVGRTVGFVRAFGSREFLRFCLCAVPTYLIVSMLVFENAGRFAFGIAGAISVLQAGLLPEMDIPLLAIAAVLLAVVVETRVVVFLSLSATETRSNVGAKLRSSLSVGAKSLAIQTLVVLPWLGLFLLQPHAGIVFRFASIDTGLFVVRFLTDLAAVAGCVAAAGAMQSVGLQWRIAAGLSKPRKSRRRRGTSVVRAISAVARRRPGRAPYGPLQEESDPFRGSNLSPSSGGT